MKRYLSILLLSLLCYSVTLMAQRVCENFDYNWKFALGNAADMNKDFTHGTEYFTYVSKVQATHQSKSPIWTGFNDSTWTAVNLPHDWVVDLPFSGEASHSHGYKTVGWKYPETSIGWYRKHFNVDKSDEGRHIYLEFEGIFRNSQVFCNGFYLGHEVSGYASQVYDISDYLNYGGDNVITVRADASTEEGWYYEGAGIYEHVRIHKTAPTHVVQYGTFATSKLTPDFSSAKINVSAKIKNEDLNASKVIVKQRLVDAAGNTVALSEVKKCNIEAKTTVEIKDCLDVNSPRLWSMESPYLYTLHTEIYAEGKKIDDYATRMGIREIKFSSERGFLLNGKEVKLKGVNMHLDHTGVGSAVPDELWRYRINKLKWMGCNAIRSSHNPAAPAMLDLCDEMGMLVIDENRLMGINDEHINYMRRMIERDRNHPSIILWSIGNEEWAIEGTESGEKIARSMCEYVHRMDSTRLATAGNAGGQTLIKGLDVQGYNYIIQNDVDGLHKRNPSWMAVGTEETSGCGTRGEYYTNPEEGYMASINRVPGNVGINNVIERGWKFYDERPWLGGLFYWTGLDYRGEPNPMKWPATGSQFGLMDYCGFPKDEAYYLKSWWTDTPTLHILPHWNLKGHEGEEVWVWVYSNCDEVELTVNGKNLGRKPMPHNGHLEWAAVYQPGKVIAQGYKNGKKTIRQVVETTGAATKLAADISKSAITADSRDVAVIDVSLLDAKNRLAIDADNDIDITITGDGSILGVGNGNPGFKDVERPATADKKHFSMKAFNGLAQVIVNACDGEGKSFSVTLSGKGLKPVTTNIEIRR